MKSERPGWARPRAKTALRRVRVDPPQGSASADAIFILMRRMRGPLVFVICVFAVDVLGLALIPGVDAAGQPYRMTAFDAFYVMSYTATTIGFGELPHSFTTAQRMWLTFGIYTSVVGWAYLVGVMFSIMQDHSFRHAVTLQRFARKVRSLREPFLIIAGYGQMGRGVTEALDGLGRRLVVIDEDGVRLDALAGGRLRIDVPGIQGDARDPDTLGLAGLGHPYCEGVLAMTTNDHVNLSIVMTVQLLRPEVPVIARSNDRATVGAMRDFRADGVINPFDDYGNLLLIRLQRPAVYQLVTWLLSPYDSPRPPRVEGLAEGRWVVLGDDRFGDEIADDLRTAGLAVDVISPADGRPEMGDAVGFVAGTSDDALNLSMAAHARLSHPEIFLSVRQRSDRTSPLLKAFNAESVFIPAQLTVQEALARVITPDFWGFIRWARTQDDAWAAEYLDHVVDRCGEGSPDSCRIVLDRASAPGALWWLQRHELTLGDLLRDPDAREDRLPLVCVGLRRAGHSQFAPGDDTTVRKGDELLLIGRLWAHRTLSQLLYDEAQIEYVATGNRVPSSWVWRKLSRRVPGV